MGPTDLVYLGQAGEPACSHDTGHTEASHCPLNPWTDCVTPLSRRTKRMTKSGSSESGIIKRNRVTAVAQPTWLHKLSAAQAEAVESSRVPGDMWVLSLVYTMSKSRSQKKHRCGGGEGHLAPSGTTGYFLLDLDTSGPAFELEPSPNLSFLLSQFNTTGTAHPQDYAARSYPYQRINHSISELEANSRSLCI